HSRRWPHRTTRSQGLAAATAVRLAPEPGWRYRPGDAARVQLRNRHGFGDSEAGYGARLDLAPSGRGKGLRDRRDPRAARSRSTDAVSMYAVSLKTRCP